MGRVTAPARAPLHRRLIDRSLIARLSSSVVLFLLRPNRPEISKPGVGFTFILVIMKKLNFLPGTIVPRCPPFSDVIKTCPDGTLVEVAPANCDRLPGKIW